MNPEQIKQLLDDRARALARPAPDDVVDHGQIELLSFTLGGLAHALTAEHLLEVVRFSAYTPLPGASELVPGLMNLRGQPLAIADLRALLGASGVEPSQVVVIGDRRPELGVLVDEVLGLNRTRLDSIRIPAGVTLDPLLLGVTNEALVVLDTDRLLTDPRLFNSAPEEREDNSLEFVGAPTN